MVAVGVGVANALAVQAADAGAEPHADHSEGGEVDLGVAVGVGVVLFEVEAALVVEHAVEDEGRVAVGCTRSGCCTGRSCRRRRSRTRGSRSSCARRRSRSTAACRGSQSRSRTSARLALNWRNRPAATGRIQDDFEVNVLETSSRFRCRVTAGPTKLPEPGLSDAQVLQILARSLHLASVPRRPVIAERLLGRAIRGGRAPGGSAAQPPVGNHEDEADATAIALPGTHEGTWLGMLVAGTRDLGAVARVEPAAGGRQRAASGLCPTTGAPASPCAPRGRERGPGRWPGRPAAVPPGSRRELGAEGASALTLD